MSTPKSVTLDANEAVASVAHRVSEVIAIYPITPASSMGELSDEWSAKGKLNLFGCVPRVMEMQSEAGAAGVVHGALQAGSLTTTFTSSQGLLLMIPNIYKIAGELTPCVIHVAARALATHALSIFGDHSDVMACRQTGAAMLCSGSVQEAQDMAAIAHAATLEARIPFLNFFDGFRTSHEVARIESLDDDTLRAMLNEDAITRHRTRALTPDHPVLRGTAQNPDVFFQAREAANAYYDACPTHVQNAMDHFGELTGRKYKLFDTVGHPEAERVIVIMGSGAETTDETVEWLNARGEKTAVVKVRLYRPFNVAAFIEALPVTTKHIAVLDRSKEPGAIGEPLYLDVVAALAEARTDGLSTFAVEPRVIGGIYGLASKEFTPAMVKAVFDELGKERPKKHFTVGIEDDVTHRSLAVDANLDIEPDEVVRAVFFGLGSDGTVGSNKETLKIIGDETESYPQGYFVYDSKKSGSSTVSHLRFSPKPLRSSYLIRRASFVACHDPQFLWRFDMLAMAEKGATFLLNTRHTPDTIWDELPREAQIALVEKKLKFFIIDGFGVAERAGLGRHLSTVMQTCFFALSGVVPREQAIVRIKKSAEKSYGKRGPEVLKRNFAAIDAALDFMAEVTVPEHVTTLRTIPSPVPEKAPEFVQRVTSVILSGLGDLLPVSAFPVDGTWPVGTSQWEKRGIAHTIPIWDASLCIQCNKCAFVCPHAAIRAGVFAPSALENAPEGYPTLDYKSGDLKGQKFAIQVAPDDCTGCGLCVAVCPAKDKSNPRHKSIDMEPRPAHQDVQRERFAFFDSLKPVDRSVLPIDIKGSQLMQPLFEFSGACVGCGETPYIKLMTQLFGDRVMIANATGCTSIYGGNLPTTPYRTNSDGRGPAWANSLFEDNAEFGLGFRLSLDANALQATHLLQSLAPQLGDEFTQALLGTQDTEASFAQQRERVAVLKQRIATINDPLARRLETLADYLVRKDVWIVGGDGWAYDIGFGGLDHVLASGQDVNILVLDTEVYSNTGGQQSKATPMGAAAKFAAAGKDAAKKDLGLIAITYGNVYVASIAFGAKDAHTVKAFEEAASYKGPSLIIAYSHCIAHGYDLTHGLDQQRLAAESGTWPLYRYDPRRAEAGESPLKLEAGGGKVRVKDYMQNEGRFRMVELADPKRYAMMADKAQLRATERRAFYEQLANIRTRTAPAGAPPKGEG